MGKIISIVPIGIQDVWDIEVEFDHSYVSHGFINHNSSSSPNLQNIPNDKERRKCFVAGDGNVLALYDYSGQEPKIFAYLTQDPLLIDVVNSGKNLYIEVSRLAFDEIIEKDTEAYRRIKALVLGLMYGLSIMGFSRDNGVDLEVAESMFEKFFETFVGVDSYMKQKTSVNVGVSYSLLGQRCHLHPYDWKWKTNALNNPMQSTASNMIKIAMKKFRKTEFYKTYHPQNKVFFVLQVHDELIVEMSKELAEEGSQILKQCMIETAELIHPGIKGNVSGGIISNWADK